jgi:hypothetical protein
MTASPTDTAPGQHWQPDRSAELRALMAQRILILDGAMGTMVQRRKLVEADYRGERFASHPKDLKGNNDLLCLTRPDVIGGIHEAYLQAGADILETNSFNGTRVSQGEYGLAELAYELNVAAATLARGLADKYSTPDKPRFVAGVLGPTSRTASLSPDVNDPGARNVSLRPARVRLPRSRTRPRRRRRGHPAGRDRVRHAQRQGRPVRHREVLRRGRPPLAADDFRHHHRRLRPHALRPDRRGLLELAAPCAADVLRLQLRAGRQGPAAPPRGTLEARRLPGLGASQRRPAECLRRLRRAARSHGGRDPRLGANPA